MSERMDARPTIPDPTAATKEALERGLAAERDYVQGQIRVLEERLSGIDRATELRLGGIEDIPHQISDKVATLRELSMERLAHLRAVTDQRFLSVQTQFAERDVRTQKQEEAASQALAAALQAAKELVGAQGEASAAAAVKSETSFTKQIDQIGTIIQTLEKALDARITELKERIDRGEGTDSGRFQQRAISSAGQERLVGLLGLLVAALVLGFIAYAAFH